MASSLAKKYLDLLDAFESGEGVSSTDENALVVTTVVGEAFWKKKDVGDPLSSLSRKERRRLLFPKEGNVISAPTSVGTDPHHIDVTTSPDEISFHDFRRTAYRNRPGLSREEPLVPLGSRVGQPQNTVGYPGSGITQQGPTIMRGTGSVPFARALVPVSRLHSPEVVQGIPVIPGSPSFSSQGHFSPPGETPISGPGFSFRRNPLQDVPQGVPRGGPPRYTITPIPPPSQRPTYDYSQMPPSPSRFSRFSHTAGMAGSVVGQGLAKVGTSVAAGIETGVGQGAGWLVRQASKRWDARKEAKKTREAMKGRLGVAPKRFVDDVIRLKTLYKDYAGFIDQKAHRDENDVQNLDYAGREAFVLQKKATERRYRQIGKVMAKQQGRQEAWNVIKATPFLARAAYVDVQGKAEGEARGVRDQELKARSGQIQKHVRDMDRWRDQYVGEIESNIRRMEQIKRAVKTGQLSELEGETRIERIFQGESLEIGPKTTVDLSTFFEGHARDFKERMRNKGKVRRRHVLALERGSLRKNVASPPKKRKLHKGKRRRGELDPPTMTRRVGKKTTLRMSKSRQLSALRKRLNKMRETYALCGEEGKHPVLHTAGKVVSLPVTAPYRVGRGVARFTGLNELPNVARSLHADAKNNFIHDFLLR